MTARDIQRRLMVERYRRSFVLYNYTPKTWFECDVFEITQAGYFREYEIKLSLSDFKADAEKQKTIWKYNTMNGRGAFDRTAGDKKHDSLRNAASHGPSRKGKSRTWDNKPWSKTSEARKLLHIAKILHKRWGSIRTKARLDKAIAAANGR